MFIILSCPRSGSTLLVQCLHAHGDIAIMDETDFIIPSAFILSRVHDPDAGKEILSRLIPNTVRYKLTLAEYFTPEEIRDIVFTAEYSLPVIVKAIFQALALKQDKKISGYKYPDDLQYSGLFAKLGLFSSDIKIIHLVRDVRDVVASLTRLGWISDPVSYMKPWSLMNLALYRRFIDQPSNYMLVRYEDLVAAPGNKLSEVCGFLGVEFRQEMLLPSRRQTGHKGAIQCENLYDDISAKNVGRHKTGMSPELVAECESRAAEAMETFGYSTGGPGKSRAGGFLKKLFK